MTNPEFIDKPADGPVAVPSEPDARMAFPTSVLTAINDAMLMDHRVKLAAQFMCSESFTQMVMMTAPRGSEPRLPGLVDFGLTLADEFIKQSIQRGWIAALPTNVDIPLDVMRHIERSGIAQVIAQMAANGFAEQQKPRVVGNPGMNGRGMMS